MSNQNKRVISGQKLGVPQLRHRRNEIWLTLTYLIQIQCSFLSRRLQIKLVNGLLLLCSQCFTALLKILRVESCPKPCVIHAKTRRGHPKPFRIPAPTRFLRSNRLIATSSGSSFQTPLTKTTV